MFIHKLKYSFPLLYGTLSLNFRQKNLILTIYCWMSLLRTWLGVKSSPHTELNIMNFHIGEDYFDIAYSEALGGGNRCVTSLHDIG
jgi:hypothetical protein